MTEEAGTTGGGWSIRRKVAVAVVVVALLAVVLWLVLDRESDGGDEADSGRTDEVQTGDRPEPYRYPVEAEGRTGSRVALTNDDDTPHTITSDDGFFDTGPIEPDETARIPSLPPGTYAYHCEIHPVLTGELVVRER